MVEKTINPNQTGDLNSSFSRAFETANPNQTGDLNSSFSRAFETALSGLSQGEGVLRRREIVAFACVLADPIEAHFSSIAGPGSPRKTPQQQLAHERAFKLAMAMNDALHHGRSEGLASALREEAVAHERAFELAMAMNDALHYGRPKRLVRALREEAERLLGGRLDNLLNPHNCFVLRCFAVWLENLPSIPIPKPELSKIPRDF